MFPKDHPGDGMDDDDGGDDGAEGEDCQVKLLWGAKSPNPNNKGSLV